MDFILKITKVFSFVVSTESSATKTAPLYNIQSSQVAELIVLTRLYCDKKTKSKKMINTLSELFII